MNKQELIYYAKLEKARRNFYYYCKLLYPSFYKEDREYLVTLCNALQDFYSNDDEFMILNAPPRHGKSFTATNFVEWVLGVNPLEKIMSASYNEDLSKVFSKKVRTTIEMEKLGENLVYNDIFPSTKIKFGSSEAMKWQTDASTQINYLATSPNGTATGFGANLEVVDDLIKNAEDANNASTLEKQFDWFVNTMLSRREGKKKVLIIMTRWNSKDLAGKLLEYLQENNIKYTHINFKALNEDTGEMLCESIFNKNDYNRAKDLMGLDIFMANYQQEPIDLKGALYENFIEYDKLPPIKFIENYTDTADTGNDFLCSINYAIGEDNMAYILDILYTKESMITTEQKVAEMLTKDNVNASYIESNNGGLGFSRNVERICRERGNRITKFKPFHQSKNKQSRILTNSTGVMLNIAFPKNWNYRFKEFHKDITAFQREGKNLHDDCADALTGVNERLQYWLKKGSAKNKYSIF